MYINGTRIKEWIGEVVAHPRAGGEVHLTFRFIAKNINEAFEFAKEYAVKVKERPEVKYTEIVGVLLDDQTEDVFEEIQPFEGAANDKD